MAEMKVAVVLVLLSLLVSPSEAQVTCYSCATNYYSIDPYDTQLGCTDPAKNATWSTCTGYACYTQSYYYGGQNLRIELM